MTKQSQLIILHLSDLHFGWEDDKTKEHAERSLVLNRLIKCVESLESEWKPGCVCITGDIGGKGRVADYQEAKDWLRELLGTLGLRSEALIVCPGNHDVDRTYAEEIIRPHDAVEADRVLDRTPVPEPYQKPFSNFSAFCRDLGIPALKVEAWDNWLVGMREFEDVRFVCLNSAWFSQDEHDTGKLWIGQPHLVRMANSGQLPSPETLHEPGSPKTVVLMHHPAESLHESERLAYGSRKNTMSYVTARSHLLLTGHTHGEPSKGSLEDESTWHLRGGAAYKAAEHTNSFRIIRIAADRLTYRCFEFDPKSPHYNWRQAIRATPLPYEISREPVLTLQRAKLQATISVIREKTAADAQHLIEQKSRALKPTGELPQVLTLGVLVSDIQSEPVSQMNQQTSRKDRQTVEMPLYEAVGRSRNTLLLGDLGTGKSTLAGLLVQEIQSSDEQALAFIAIARKLAWQAPLTPKSLLQALSGYINDVVAPEIGDVDLQALLEQNTEMTVIVDGLDEIEPDKAAELASQLAALSAHWPTVRVAATARPAELSGVSLGDWQRVAPAPLDDDDRLSFFRDEALAEGMSPQNAAVVAKQLVGKLKALPALQDVANSPLAVRLIYPRLAEESEAEAQTLGDLLFDLVKERLESWARRDTKGTPYGLFEASFADAFSRAVLLGRLALEFLQYGKMTEEQALALMQEWFKQDNRADTGRLANEALKFFASSGLISVDREIVFPIQPLFELASGFGIAQCWHDGRSEEISGIDKSHWRSISFAATVMRRLGWIAHQRQNLEAILISLLGDRRGIPPASYIVSESRDEPLAGKFVELMPTLGLRPLMYAQDDRGNSARATAEAIRLAGKAGFDWLFAHYLDPRHPTINTGSRIIDDVFNYWIRASIGKLSTHEKTELRRLVMPHVEAETYQLLSAIPLLSLAIPKAFDLQSQLWFSSAYLGDKQFAHLVEEHFRTAFAENSRLVNQVLLARVKKGYERSALAAQLWLDLNPGMPPLEVVRGFIRALGKSGWRDQIADGIDRCRQRVGDDRLVQLTRWYVFGRDESLASGSALYLYQVGERRLNVLGDSLLRAMHDGGYVKEAEDALDSMVEEGQSQPLYWLAERIKSAKQDMMGAHSGWWRVFLKHLPRLGPEAAQVFAESVSAIGQFLLPRRPEVRQGMRNLLEGGEGSKYVDALRKQLHHYDPALRHGSAMVLVACYSPIGNDALEVVLRSRSRRSHGDWREWEQFCLSLAYGPSVLAFVKSILRDLDPLGHAFALAILHRNDVRLDDQQYAKLVIALQDWHNWSLESQSEPICAEDRAYQVLVELVEERTDDVGKRAAERLLWYHRDRLSTGLYATCVSVQLQGHWDLPSLEIIDQSRNDSAFGSAVQVSADGIVARGGVRPLLDLIRRAVENAEGWEAVVWRLLCDDSKLGMEFDDQGQWLLDYGRLAPEHSKAIGTAAMKLLDDPRVRNSRWVESRQWLALLADEFADLSKPAMEELLSGRATINGAVTSALLARLGHVPHHFGARHSVGSVPRSWPSSKPITHSAVTLYARLMEFARASENLHPGICHAIEQLLVAPPVSEDKLYSLAAESEFGALAASALAFAYGSPANRDYVMRLLGHAYYGQTGDECLTHLVKAFRAGSYALTAEDPETRRSYVQALGERLVTAEDARLSSIARELLSLTGKLDPTQAEYVFDKYVYFGKHYDHGLGAMLAHWLSGDAEEATASSIMRSIRRGLPVLDSETWDTHDRWPAGALPFLLLPLAYWKLAGVADQTSVRVFLRGVKFLFTGLGPERSREWLEEPEWVAVGKLTDVIEHLQPLISAVPRNLIEGVIEQGERSEDPVARALCHLLSGFRSNL